MAGNMEESKTQVMMMQNTTSNAANGTKSKAVKSSKKKHKKKKWPIVLGIVLAVIVGLCVWAVKAVEKAVSEMGAVVSTATVTRGDLQEHISAGGTVRSEEVLTVFAPVSGKVETVNVAAGDEVEAGMSLVTYDMESFDRSLQQAALQLEKTNAGLDNLFQKDRDSQAKLNEATVNLEVLNQQIKDNKNYLETLQDALVGYQRDTGNALAVEALNLQAQLNGLAIGSDEYKQVSAALARNTYEQQNVGSHEEVLELQKKIADVQELIVGYEEYKARMESQRNSSEATVMNSYDKTQYDVDSQLALMSYQAAEADYNDAFYGITADFKGIVTECSAVPGAMVSEGTKLITLENIEKLKVTFQASKYDIEKLSLGQKVEVTISGRVYEGEISRINRMATRNETNTPVVGVEAHILNPDENIILGLDAKLTIYTNKSENVLMVPVEAVNGDKDGDFLYVVENGFIAKKSVVCGITTDNYIEIKEGIDENAEIVLNSYTALEEGMMATVIPPIDMPQNLVQ